MCIGRKKDVPPLLCPWRTPTFNSYEIAPESGTLIFRRNGAAELRGNVSQRAQLKIIPGTVLDKGPRSQRVWGCCYNP